MVLVRSFMRLETRISYSFLSEPHNGQARHRRAPPERSGALGVPASDGVGGSGGAKPPG